MAPIDHMKVVACVTRAFNGEQDIEIKASHKKVNIYDVTVPTGGKAVSYELQVNGRDIEMTIARKHFKLVKFDRWLSRLEFELEQAFLANIRLEVKDSSPDYTISIFN
ncbi:MAG TPA: hypothetical protein VLM75_11925 [Spirochaetota bacterium]|nr:hypothetical protein [Spirochaetota bacterium]